VCHKYTLCEPPAKVKKEARARQIKMRKCQECDEEFPNVDELANHISTTCTKRFPCSGCDRHYKNKRDRNRHYAELHTNRIQNPEERTRICDTCGAEFANQQSLNKHKKEQHDPTYVKKRVYFPCHEPGCRKVLQSKHAFATHKALLHSDRRKLFECDFCGRKFRTLGTIRSHVVEHATNPNELLTVPCDFCDKKFVDKQSLKLHHRAHVCKYLLYNDR
jgi:KRAB domain-containing zinc finger protein